MAVLNWDHSVHYVNNLDEAIETFAKSGIVVQHGGSHKQWGTNNALMYFDLSYVEFMGIENRDLVKTVLPDNRVVTDSIKHLPDHQILSRIAIRSTNVEETHHHLLDMGINAGPILDGKRLDTNGNLIEWKMFTIDQEFHGLYYPFFIQWKGTDNERLECLKETGVVKEHPAGICKMKKAVWHVPDPKGVVLHWSDMLGLPYEAIDDGYTISIGEKVLVFSKGPENRIVKLVVATDSDKLTGTSICFGEGEYEFIPLH